MSSTLTTTQMVARLQRKFPIGLSANDCMDFLNEGFRKIDQMSKGGFLWQVAVTTIALPAGVATQPNLPSDFDPGKSAWLRGSENQAAITTIIPFKSYQEFYNQQHFSNSAIGLFSAWTFRPANVGPAMTYVMILAPDEAYPLPNPLTMRLTYHRLSFAPLTVGAFYFPTPDQFDSLIIDLAEAEFARVYGRAGWEKVQGNAMQSVSEMIDSYRTDKFDLAGLQDSVMQAQERQADKAK